MSLTIKTTIIAATALGLLFSGAMAKSPSGFTFQDAEFLPTEHDGILAAKSFVAASLTPGLPMREAVMRVEQARASCNPAVSPTAIVNCEYFILARPTEGGLGENVWTVHLVPAPNGTLESASVERSRVGMSDVEQVR